MNSHRTVASAAALAWLLAAAACSDRADAPEENEARRFVGRQACVRCHEDETRLWEGSHHDLAMDVASEDTVLGDFNGATFEKGGVTTTFRRDGESFLVTTDGPDGELGEYEVTHTFGVVPLQQYLVPFPGGRVQTLGVAWDARPAEEGGQRWFHLYPDEDIPHDDVLHWTGVLQNWNFMCAECHSTDLQRGYDVESDTYETTWSEINVSCEACHGPGSAHVAWADAGARGRDPRLDVRLNDTDGGQWVIDSKTGIAERSVERKEQTQVEACARCHSRRSPITSDYVYGRPLLDTHVPALLEERLYHADGQILEEVYVWGSFVQSRMYAAGVTCSDCHDSHSLTTRYGGSNTLCAKCHEPERFDSPEHHFHEVDNSGARCVECHMPARTYMVVDPRRDHSMRIPRPDLSLELGTPNACNDCHDDQTVQWAADAVVEWYGPREPRAGEYERALHAGHTGSAGAGAALMALAQDEEAPAIARATSWALLRERLSRDSLAALEPALHHPDPLIRRSAVGALLGLDPRERLQLAVHLLEDPLLAVRAEAARVLAAVPPESVPPEAKEVLEAGLREYVETQNANADRAESWVNLGVFHLERGHLAKAERAYRAGIERNPYFSGARINLADLFRSQGREWAADQLLREGLEVLPDDPDIHHSLGLSLVRSGRLEEALAELQRAAELAPDLVRYGYVHAIARHDAGEPERAVAALEGLHLRHPHAREVLEALALFSRDLGRREAALVWARKLVDLEPGDEGAQALLAEISKP